jgi:hypothetical protein
MRSGSDRRRVVRASAFQRCKIGAVAGTAMVLALAGWVPVWPDEFGRLDGARLFELPGRKDARMRSSIGLRELEALPEVLPGERAALVLVKTDGGNLAKLLVSSGLRKVKPSEKESPAVPVLMLERFETVDGADHRSFKARGKEVMLFDGFQFDLDTGCVVPDGMGGDILFSTRGTAGPRLASVGPNGLCTLEKAISAPALAVGAPSSGRAVQATDFAGRYYLIANGQWSGTLELAVDAAGAVSGHFRSDKNGSSYIVEGAVSPEIPHKLQFSIQFPRAKQTYEGLLWTEGKNAIAGTLTMLDRPYGFVAVREGSSLAPEAADFAPKAKGSTPPQARE